MTNPFKILKSQFGGDIGKLVSGSLTVVLLRALGTGTQFLFYLYIARKFGSTGMGLFLLSLTIVTITSIAGRLGMDFYVVRYVSVHAEEEAWGQLKHGWLKMLNYAFLGSITLTAILYLMAPWLTSSIFSKPDLLDPLRWMVISIVPFSLLNLIAESLRAVKRFKEASIVQGVLIPIITIIAFFLISQFMDDISGAAVAYTISTACVLAIAVFLWIRAMPQLKSVSSASELKGRAIFSVALPLTFMSLAATARGLLDFMILGYFAPTSEVGVYGAALRTSMLMSLLLIGVHSILAPKFAVLFSQGRIAKLENISQLGTFVLMVLALPLFLIFIIFPQEILALFGGSFQGGAVPLIILATGQLINAALISSSITLLMAGYERLLQWLNILALILNLVLCLTLIPGFGATGAAVANTISLVVLNISAFLFAIKRIGISTLPFIKATGS